MKSIKNTRYDLQYFLSAVCLLVLYGLYVCYNWVKSLKRENKSYEVALPEYFIDWESVQP